MDFRVHAFPPPTWMQKPESVPGCPVGLEYLLYSDQILVHPQVELIEALIGVKGSNKYEIKNSAGHLMYSAVEDSNCCVRICCSPRRCFSMNIIDNFGKIVMVIERPCTCSCLNICACISPCQQSVTIQAPPGIPLGYVHQTWSILAPTYVIRDANGTAVLKLSGPPCLCRGPCGWCIDQNFQIQNMSGTRCGSIDKQWSGQLGEFLADADKFEAKFPVDLDVKVKGVLLGAVFLIDFMYFDPSSRRRLEEKLAAVK